MTYEEYVNTKATELMGVFPRYTQEDIKTEIESARFAINMRRRFTPTLEVPLEEQYYHLLIQLTIEALNKRGAEGQVVHNENGVNRGYDNASPYSQALLGMIISKAKSL